MAEKVALEIDINAKGATTSLGQLEEEAERLNEELRKVPLGTKAFKDLKQELVGVNKQIKNTELSMEALDNEQVASELGSVAGAVGDVSAAFILLGGGGGPLEETVQNIEKGIGISMAFKGAIEGTQSGMKLFNNVIKNSTAFQKLNNATTVIATTIMGLFSKSVDTTSKSFKFLKGAIIATGIGALVVGVGLLIANFDKIKNSIMGISEASKDLQATTKATTELNKKNLETLNNQENILKLQGKTEREILMMKIDGQKKVVESIKNELAAQKVVNEEKIQGSKRNQRVLQFTIKLLSAAPLLLLKTIDFLGEGVEKLINSVTQSAVGKKIFGLEPIDVDFGLSEKANKLIEKASTLVFDPEETEAQGKEDLKKLEEQLMLQENALAGFQLRAIDMDAKAAKTKQDKIDKVNTDAKAKRDKKNAKEIAEQAARDNQAVEDYMNFLQAKEDLENLYFESLLTQQQQEENAVADKYFNLIEQARLYGEDITVLEQAQQHEINEIKNKFAKEDLERQQAVEDAKIGLAIDGVGALINLTSAFAKDNEKSQRKAFEINKKLQIAQAIMSTYQGANAIFSAAALNPATVLFPAQPFIAAGIAIVNGLANVASISKQQFQTSSPGGGGVQTPSFGGGGGTPPTLQPANTSTLVPQQQTQVFVTETDITSTQNSVAVIQGQATF
tara:strand:- start:2445 stop:4475 length:2031 start_codon:yes stop_codon:yes gene_type:complete